MSFIPRSAASPSAPELLHAVEDFRRHWEELAEACDRTGDRRGKELISLMLRDLRDRIGNPADATVGLKAAAKLSGYSERQLRRLLDAGLIEDRGCKGAPRIRIKDLPARPGRKAAAFRNREINRTRPGEAA